VSRIISAIIIMAALFCACSLVCSAAESRWVISEGNEKFIADIFDSGENSAELRTDSIRIEGSRISIALSNSEEGTSVMLYLTCSPPQTRTDECRSFYDIWLCAEKASFSDALPGSYLQWLQSRNPEGAKLKSLFRKVEINEDTGSRVTKWRNAHNFFYEHFGFLVKYFYIVWFLALAVLAAFSLGTLRLRNAGGRLTQLLRVLIILLLIMISILAIAHLAGGELILKC